MSSPKAKRTELFLTASFTLRSRFHPTSSPVGAVNVLLGYQRLLLVYLPLTHVLEYTVELVMIFVGMPCDYGRVKTLTDASVWNCKKKIKCFPTSIIVGLPAVWENFPKSIVAPIAEAELCMYIPALRRSQIYQLRSSLSDVRAATGG